MGQILFQCPRCGARSKMGQRSCLRCHTPFYYTCANCRSYVDMSYRFCPNCSTTLDWEIKPKAKLLPPPNPKPASSSGAKYAVAIMLVAALILVGLTATGYITYRTSFEEPLVFVGYDSSEEPEVASDMFSTSQPVTQYSGSPPYVISEGDAFSLANNPDAVDVTFDELKSFITADKTDDQSYVSGTRMCGYFSETVHNNAEKAGIKAAVAIIGFEGNSTLHALNAFNTTDRGLVFIDCTGVSNSPVAFEEWLRKLFYPTGEDRVAYIEKGKEYGTIMLSDAESTQYSYYAGYKKSWISEQDFFLTESTIVKSITVYW